MSFKLINKSFWNEIFYYNLFKIEMVGERLEIEDIMKYIY